MSVSSSVRTVCKEVFDENSAPSEEEIKEYALKIGIDPVTESHLLHIARDGLMRALPEGWAPCYDKVAKAFYYHNYEKNRTQWDHPLDDVYRDIVKKVKTESISSTGEEDSKTSAKEDLKSFEEVTIPSEMLPKPTESLKPPLGGGAVRKGSLQLAPLRKPPSPSPLGPISSLHDSTSTDAKKKLSLPFKRDLESPRGQIDLSLKRSISNTELGARSPTLLAIERGSNESLPARSPSRIDIDNMLLTKTEPLKKKDSLSPLQEKHPRSLYGGELTLKGGGSMFLKSKQKKSEDVSSNIDLDSDLKSIEVVTSESRDQPKGILREPIVAKQLWDMDPREMSQEEKQLWKKQELEDERKSVRFNLEKDLKIGFHVSDSEDEEVKEEWNSEEQDSDERVIAGVKVADILNRMDSSEVDEPLVSEHNLDELETQVEKTDGEERNTQIITDKLKGLYLTDSRSKDIEATREKYMSQLRGIPIEMLGGFMSPKLSEEVTFLKNIKLKTPQEIKEMNSLNMKEVLRDSPVKDAKISEKRQLGSDLFRNDIISKSVENIVLNGDLDKSSLDYDLGKQADIMFEDNAEVEKKLEHRRLNLEQQLHEIEAQSEERMKALRDQLKEEERAEKNRLKMQLERRMSDFEASLALQQESQQQMVKENMKASLNQARETLSGERELQMKILKSEFELKFSNERRKLELECKEKIESLKVDMAEMMKRMEDQQKEEKKKLMDEITSKGKTELEELKLKLLGEMQEKHAELMQKHSQNFPGLASEVNEIRPAEQSLDLIVSKKNEDLENASENIDQVETSQNLRLKALELEHHQEEEKMKMEHTAKIIEIKSEFSLALETIRDEHKSDEALLRRDQEIMIEKLRSDHVMRLEALRNDCLKEEEVIRREHLERLNELKSRLEAERQRLKGHADDKDASGLVFEKLRCEKRLLEDKYRTLKDKYVRLKGDVKLSVERRRKRDMANNTGSETERSTSHRTTDRSGVSDSAHGPKNDNDKPPTRKRTENNNGASNKNATSPKNLLSRLPSEEVLQGVDSDNVSSSSSKLPSKPVEHPRKRRQLLNRLNKSASTSRINNNPLSDDGKSDPVENLRRQLQKLDDLEDQFPPATHTDTYLRYPFSDPGQCGSSELEFFRHRIHLERESVRRAKDFLQVQRDSFRARQRELRRRHVHDAPLAESAMSDQLADEERELTDMEVSLHRTRALLGEKIIRLRHLEQSLHRAATPKVAGDEAATLSDISSHSGGSSGFNSIEIHPEEQPLGTIGMPNATRTRSGHYNESTEIIRSLENLNTEIHDIWEVLNKARPSAIPPPPFVHPDWLSMPTARLGYRQQYAPPTLIEGQYGDPSLVERTKTLRDWLRQARIDSAELTSPGQATL